MRRVAAVHRQGVTDNKARCVAAQPKHGRGDLLRTAEASDRLFPQNLFHCVRLAGEHAGHHRCVNDAWTDRVDPDASRRIFDRSAPGHADHSVFAGKSFVICCQRTIPMMAPGGSIVAVASDAGKVATPAETVIGAMEAAVIMFSRTLAMEVSRQGIRVNVVTPSLVANTVSYDRVMSGETSGRIFGKATSKAKLGLPTPEDVAPLAVFLSSPSASKITGQAVSVNGGISAA